MLNYRSTREFVSTREKDLMIPKPHFRYPTDGQLLVCDIVIVSVQFQF